MSFLILDFSLKVIDLFTNTDQLILWNNQFVFFFCKLVWYLFKIIWQMRNFSLLRRKDAFLLRQRLFKYIERSETLFQYKNVIICLLKFFYNDFRKLKFRLIKRNLLFYFHEFVKQLVVLVDSFCKFLGLVVELEVFVGDFFHEMLIESGRFLVSDGKLMMLVLELFKFALFLLGCNDEQIKLFFYPGWFLFLFLNFLL